MSAPTAPTATAATTVDEPQEIRLYLPVAKIYVAAKTWGPSSGYPVMCLHGWLDNCNSFVPLATELMRQLNRPVHLVAVDLPGHGLSDHKHPTVVLEFVSDVNEIALALGWRQKFMLIAHSMGGITATFFAAALPERLSRLVIIDAIGPRPAHQPMHLQLGDGIRSRQVLAAKSNRIFPSKEEAAKALQKKNPTMLLSSALALVERGTKPVGDGFQFRHDIQLRATSLFVVDEQQVRETFQAIQCPAMMLVPEFGLIETTRAKGRLRYIPKWRVVRIPGGHHVHLDDPALVAHHVAPFIEEEEDQTPADSAALADHISGPSKL